MTRITSVVTLLRLVTGTLVAVLVAVFAMSAMDAWRREGIAFRIQAAAHISRDIVIAREDMRVEMGVTDTLLYQAPAASPAQLADLARRHARTMTALNAVQAGIREAQDVKVPAQLRRALDEALVGFDRHIYPAVVKALKVPFAVRPIGMVDERTLATRAVLSVIDEQAAFLSRDIATYGPYLADMMRVSDVAWHVRVDAGDQRGNIADLLSRQRSPPDADHETFVKLDGQVEAPWRSF